MEGSVRVGVKTERLSGRCDVRKERLCGSRQGDKCRLLVTRERENLARKRENSKKRRGTVDRRADVVELDQLGTDDQRCHVSSRDPRLASVSVSWINITEVWQRCSYPTLYLYVPVRRRRPAPILPLVAFVLRRLGPLGLCQFTTTFLIFFDG